MHPPLNIKIFKTRILSFHFFGTIGYFLGVILGVWLAHTTGLAIWPVIVCSLTGAGVLFALTYSYKILTGREDLVYYQHELAIIACCLLLLLILQLPVLQYLDITLMGIGVFLVFGRIGCFSVGCCHGRIGRFGVIYTEEHVAEGFHRHFAGIPVFPVQLIESACVLVTVSIGAMAIVNKQPPGTALLLYTVIYGLVRFTLEYFRGDTERPYWLGFSEAQWTTLGIFLVSVVLSFFELVPYYNWHIWTLPALASVMLATALVRQFQTVPAHKIRRPGFVLELAESIETLEQHFSKNGQVLLLRTSLKLNISRGILADTDELAIHYTVSGEQKQENSSIGKKLVVNKKTAKILAKIIQTLKHPRVAFEIIEGKPGIFHIVFHLPVTDNEDKPVESEALKLRRYLRHSYN